MGGNRNKWVWLAIGAIILLIYPFILTLPFPRHLMIMIFLYASLGLAWNMIGGYAGQNLPRSCGLFRSRGLHFHSHADEAGGKSLGRHARRRGLIHRPSFHHWLPLF